MIKFASVSADALTASGVGAGVSVSTTATGAAVAGLAAGMAGKC